jgi:hypothetical protein
VNGGTSGIALVYLTSATMGATVTGNGGEMDLLVQGGGTETMGANQTGITTVKLLDPNNDFTANAETGLTIVASSGDDTVTVGDASQTVINTGGTLDVKATAAQAGVNLGLGRGSTTLEITTGGTVTLNAADSFMAVQLDAASTLDLTAPRALTITGSAGDDTFDATAAALSVALSLDGGGGTNTLALQGGGFFALNYAGALTNIQTVTATEGLGGSEPAIALRAGLDLTVDIQSGGAGAQAVVFGAANNDIINLGNGTDFVYGTAGTETVNGGTSGTAVVYLTGATMGATITGNGGEMDLLVQGGGTETMGANQTGITTVKLLDPNNDFTANSETGLTIVASSGDDTVTVGDASQTVINTGGTLDVKATAAQAGVNLGLGRGSTTLDITTGGTATLNAADSFMTVRLDAAATLNMGGLGFITAIGSGGNDVIQAGGAAQTLVAGGGLGDTLVGFAGFGDTFKDTSADLNGVTIQNYGGNDVIDLTDLLPGSASLTFNADTLTVTDGTHSAAISLTGSFTQAGFHLATDNHGGTTVTYG